MATSPRSMRKAPQQAQTDTQPAIQKHKPTPQQHEHDAPAAPSPPATSPTEGGVQAHGDVHVPVDAALPNIHFPLPRKWIPCKHHNNTAQAATHPMHASAGGPGSSSRSSSPARSAGRALHFTVMSYNILAQCLVRRDMFPYASTRALKTAFRRENLLLEFLYSKADILCLQEVDVGLYEQHYRPKLHAAGYDSRWGAKQENGKHGCAIFFNKKKFRVLSYDTHHFSTLAFPYAHLPDNHPTPSPTSVYEELNRGNVAQLLRLQLNVEEWNDKPHKQSKSSTSSSPRSRSPSPAASSASCAPSRHTLLVTNHHLFWHPSFRFVRLKQVHSLLSIVDEHVKTHGDEAILCGDWNMTPDNVVYQYLTRRHVDEQQWNLFFTPPEHGQPRMDEGAPTEPVEPVAATPPVPAPADAPHDRPHDDARQARLREVRSLLDHGRTLVPVRSVYADYEHRVTDPSHSDPSTADAIRESYAQSYCRWRGEPPFTNYTAKFKGTLDYIVVPDRPGRCVPAAVLGVPLEPAVSVHTALPDDRISSDHVSIACAFQWNIDEAT